MIPMLLGFTVAASVFAAVLWSLFQIVTQRGRLQWAHIGTVVFSLAGMVTISWILPPLAMVAGGLLAIAAVSAAKLEPRWNKVFPIFQLVFAISLILGLPFTGN